MNGPILITLDGSEFSEAALPWALEASQRLGVGLDVVSVAEPIPTLEYAEWNADAERWVAEYIDRIVGQCAGKAGGDVTGAGLAGQALDSILNRADEVGASCIVAATHGRGPMARAWLGSVADGLLRTAGVPVLLVRPTEADDYITAPAPEPGTVLVSLDGSRDSEAALELATTWARAFESKIHLVQVVTYPNEIASPYLPQTVALNRSAVEEAMGQAKEHITAIAADLRGKGLEVAAHVTEDIHGPGGIVRIAEDVGAGLLVMATHGRGGIRRALLGSVTDKVVRSTDIPVLVTHVPHDGS